MVGELPHLMQTYAPPSAEFVRGEGVYLYDKHGRAYLDFISGLGVNLLGHCPPEIVRAVRDQADRLFHASNLYRIEGQVQLARRLCEASFADRAYFCNSGAEATDSMIKIARYFFHKQGEAKRNRVLAFDGGFHGRTYGAISVTSRGKVREGFKPLLPGIDFVPFNNLNAAKKKIGDRTCLVLVEPILGEGGVVPAERGFLAGLRRLCDDRGALLGYDELQCGLSRIGRPFAYQYFGVEPDLLALGKGLGGGLPMAAVLAREPAASALEPGTHGSTFGGNPMSCAASLAVCRRVLNDRFAARVERVGMHLLEQLQQRLGGHPRVKTITGIGLMAGVELDRPGQPCVEACLARGLLINCTAERVLRLLPPLIVTEKHCRDAAATMAEALAAVER